MVERTVAPSAPRTVGVLVGGGPAPGINAVINAVVLSARNRGWRVLGIPWGFSRLMAGDVTGVLELDDRSVARVAGRGGSMLFTSRANPTKDEAALQRVVQSLEKLGVTDLVTIGGDDTASSAIRVSQACGGRIRVAHVPKTIDNDLPLPRNAPTFGFETAKDLGSMLVQNLSEDAKTTGRWYFVTAMGRTAGHLALGIGAGGSASVTVIPEEFPAGSIRLADVASLVESVILKRRAAGKPHGVAVLAEGILARMDPADLALLEDLERDEHGHPRLSEVSLGRVVRSVVQQRLRERGIDVGVVAKEIGYELRCADAIAFDVHYGRNLGVGAARALAEGFTSVLVSYVDGVLVPIPFEGIRDPATGRVRTRLVDPKGDEWLSALQLQSRLRPHDLEGEGLKRLAEAAREDAAAVAARFRPFVVGEGGVAPE